MTPNRPYFMRALYEWIVDNHCTPYILVDALHEEVKVPQQYVKDGQIVLNISPGAVIDLTISNQSVVFNGRFGGVATDIYVPVAAVVGLYARENGHGMVFEPEDSEPGPRTPDDDPTGPGRQDGRPSLKIVK